MANNKKDPFGPPRKQDEYVTGGAGGTGDNNNGSEGCGKETATMVVAFTALVVLARAALRNRRG